MISVEFEAVTLSDDGGTVSLVSSAVVGRSRARLHIWVGEHEAALVSIASTGRRPLRPITHDLVTSLMADFEIVIERATMTRLHDGIVHAEIVVVREGKRTSIDCRPADAIALALRQDAPLFVSSAVMRAMSEPVAESSDPN